MPAEGYKFRGCVYSQPRCIYPEACMAGFGNPPKVGRGVKRPTSPRLQTRPQHRTDNGGQWFGRVNEDGDSVEADPAFTDEYLGKSRSGSSAKPLGGRQ